MRTQKTVDGVTTEYYTVGGKLLAEKTGDQVLTFHYDEKGAPVSVELNGTRYFYCLNLQGDVVGLKTSSSYDQLVVEYTYDPWGKLLNITDTSGTDIGTLNPLRYRGYYYDTETGFYFLQSRYYDPTVGRFINADGQLSGVGGDMQGYNLFAYCGNDPINRSDPTGCFWEEMMDFLRELLFPNVDYTISTSSGPRVEDSLPAKGRVTLSKKATNRRDSGLTGMSDEEVQRKARDKSLSGKERNRYKQEEKVRGLRNKQKRQSNITPDQTANIVKGVAYITVSSILITALCVDDASGIGIVDDYFIPPLSACFEEGVAIIIYACST